MNPMNPVKPLRQSALCQIAGTFVQQSDVNPQNPLAMKNRSLIAVVGKILVAFIAAFCVSSGYATISAYEPFNYTTGSFSAPASTATATAGLTTAGGFTGSWSGSGTIVSGLTDSTLPVANNALSENAQTATTTLATSITSGTYYIAFLFHQNTTANTGNNGGNASGFEIVNSANTGIIFGQTAGFSGTAGNFQLCPVTTKTTVGASKYSGSGNDVYGTTYLMVVQITGSGSGWSGSVWINPPVGTSSPGTATGTFTGISQFTFSQITLWNAGGGNADVFDEIRIGTTYADAIGFAAAPSAPGSVVATAGTSQNTLSWASSSGATSYNVLRGTSSGGESSLSTGVTTTGYTDSTAANGTKYYYLVQAVSSSGTSGNSSEVSGTPIAQPTGFSATGSANQVTLSWSSASGATSYNLKRSTSTGTEVNVANLTGTAYTDTAGGAGIVDGTTYFYKVSGTNVNGESTSSSEQSATPTLAAPAAPTGVTMTVNSTPQVTLSWSSSVGATSYNVLSSTTSGAETSLATGLTSTHYTDSTAVDGTIVYYEIQAVNAAGASPNSSEVSTNMPPGTATGLSATPGINQATLTWTAPTGASPATSYNVLRSTTSGSETSLQTGVGTTAYTDSTATDGHTYYYEVVAVNASGHSANSSESSALLVPAAPTGVTETPGDNQVTLGWTAASGATSYNVLSSTTSGAETTLATGVTSPAYTDSTAVDGTTSFYIIQGVNATGNSLNSAEVSSEPAQALTGLSATPGSNSVALTWNASTGAVSYNVKRSTTSGAETTISTSGSVTSGAYTDTTAVNGQTYYYKVSTVNTTGEGANSAEVGPELMFPAIPGGVTETPGDTQVTLSWSAAAGAVSYNVMEATTSGAETILTNVTGTSVIDNIAAVDGVTNFYIIQASNATGVANSAEVQSEPIQTPTGLTAVANSTPQVVLSWSSATGATNYTVLRSTTSGTETTLVTGVATAGYTDSTAVPGNTYFYKVAGANSTGQGANSAEASAIMVPATPTGVAQTPGDSQVALTWSAASGATSYNVLRSTTSGSGYSTITSVSSPTTAYTDTGLTDGTTYYYVIQGVNATGNSANSSQVTSAPLAAVTGLGATAGNNSVALTWSAASGATSYTVKRSTTSGAETTLVTGVTAAAYTDSTALNGSTYYYIVQGVNATGTGGNSSEVNSTPTGPQAPTGLTATGGSGQITLSWTAGTGATSYNVKRSTTSGSGYVTLTASGAQTTTAFTDTGTAPGTTYFYVVSSVNGVGESANSAQASAAPNAAGAAVYEPFNYSSITAGTTHTGTGETGNWAGSASIVTGLTYSGLTTANSAISENAQNASIGLSSSITSGTYYISFLFRQATSVNGGNNGGNFSGLELVNSSGTGIVIGQVNTFSQSQGDFGVAPITTTTSMGTVQGQNNAGDTYGTTYLMVIKITGSGSGWSGSYWVNPTIGSTAPVTTTGTFSGISQFTFSQITLWNAGGGNADTFDEVRVATSYGAAVGQTAAGTPTISSATPLSGQVNLGWSTVSGATSYNVLRSTTSGAEQSLVTGLTSPAYTDSSVVNGTTYYYEVQAVNGIGAGSFSSETNATPVAVPGAPTLATPTTAANTVFLSWTAPSTGGPVVSYTLKRSTTSGAETSYATGLTGTAYTDSAAAGGNTYYYVLQALNASGTGANSSEVQASPPIALPSAPASLTATANTTPQVVLSWPVGTGAASYNVKRSTTSGAETTISTTGAVTGTGYTDSAVANGNVYYYEVSSTNSAGESANTAEMTASMAPAAPTTFGATAGSNQVTLSWTAPAGASGATSYNVLRSTTSGAETSLATGVSGTAYTDSTALSGTTYFYKVAGVNTTGQGTISSEQSATPTGAPQVPTGVSATPGSGSVALSWTASLGNPASYNVLRSTTSGSETTLVTGVTGTSYTDSGTAPGTTYYYVISAVNTYGTSANSSEVSGAPLATGASVYESFNYSSITGGTTTPTGTGESGTAWSGSGSIVTGLTYSGLTTANNALSENGQNASVGLASSISSGTYYVSFLFQQATGVNSGNNGGNFAGLELANSSGNGIVIGQLATFSQSQGSFAVAPITSTTSVGSVQGVDNAGDTYGTTYLIVMKITSTGSGWSGSYWVNPTIGSTAPTATGTFSGISQFTISQITLWNAGGGNADTYDEIQVGATFGSVVGVTAPSSAPAGVSATGGNNSVALSWTSVSGATSYNVLRSTASGIEQGLASGVTGTAYTDSTATNGTTYYYVVQAVNGVGGSAFSSEVSATPAPIPPTANPVTYLRPDNLALKIKISDLLTNVSNPDGNPLTLVGVGIDGYNLTTTNGVTLTTNSTFILYTNSVSANVNDKFEYTVSDGISSPVSGVLTITPVGGQTGQLSGSMSVDGFGNVVMTFYGVPGSQYNIQGTPSLTPPITWTNIPGSPFTAYTNGLINATDTPAGSSEYYQLSTP